jgi:hypothetical protein
MLFFSYSCKWYEKSISNKYKRLLNFMILRSQKRCLLTAGTIYILDLQNFSAVTKIIINFLKKNIMTLFYFVYFLGN